MKLDLKQKSWEAIFDSVRDSNINAKGSFWAAIQSLEDQLQDELTKPVERIREPVEPMKNEEEE